MEKREARRNYAGFITLIMVVGLAVAIYASRQTIQDRIRLYNYTPSAATSELASDGTFSTYARRIFYVNHPQLNGRAAFNKNCPNNGGEQTIILGCYHANQNGIYLYDITDVRLNGVEQVTAAHEMLHAAYDRLSTKERNRVNALLQDYYDHTLTDKRLRDVVESYKKSEPNDVVNEMHSIFGTESDDLPAALTTYYAQYFQNRQTVVTYAHAYQGEFTSRQNQISAYDRQLTELKEQISSGKAALNSKSASLAATRQQLATGPTGDANAYSAQVSTYNADVKQYNEQLAVLRSTIAEYNRIVDTRNALALEEQQLSQSIDSNLTPLNNQ